MWTRALFSFVVYSALLAVLYVSASDGASVLLRVLAAIPGVLLALYVSGAFSALEASSQESVAALARRITWWRFLLVILCFAVNALVVRRLSELDAPWARLSIVALALIPGALLAAILGWRAKLASEVGERA
jgi:hypothetical protein